MILCQKTHILPDIERIISQHGTRAINTLK
jgi:hypothetical protein